MESFSSLKRGVYGMRESFFFKNTFVNIFDFVDKSQSLIRKVSAVEKKMCC